MKRKTLFSKSQLTVRVVPQYRQEPAHRMGSTAVSAATAAQLRVDGAGNPKVAAVHRHFVPTITSRLLLYYPAFRLLASFNRGFLTPLPPPFGFGRHAPGLRGAPSLLFPLLYGPPGHEPFGCF